MIFLRVVLTLSMICLSGIASAAANPSGLLGAIWGQDEVSHGGGCRKSSPPGQCCHMEKATGKVHCH